MFHYMVILHIPAFMWFTACPFGQFLAPHVDIFFELLLTITVFENRLNESCECLYVLVCQFVLAPAKCPQDSKRACDVALGRFAANICS